MINKSALNRVVLYFENGHKPMAELHHFDGSVNIINWDNIDERREYFDPFYNADVIFEDKRFIEETETTQNVLSKSFFDEMVKRTKIGIEQLIFGYSDVERLAIWICRLKGKFIPFNGNDPDFTSIQDIMNLSELLLDKYNYDDIVDIIISIS